MKINNIAGYFGEKETRKRTIFLLLLIIAIGFSVRTYIWFNGYNPETNITLPAAHQERGLVRHGDGYLFIASSFDPSNDRSFFDHKRSYFQFIYPLYLAPIYLFGLNDSIYVFWLHHLFAALTIIFIYLSAYKIGKTWVGLLAALAYACHIQSAYWFNWVFSDIPFHFHLSLLMYCGLLCWERPSRMRVFLMAISGVVLMFTRTEGFAITLVSLMVLAYRFMVPRLGATRVITIFLGSVLIFLLLGVFVLTQSKAVREVVFSNYSLAWGLYYSSQETPTNAKLVDEMLIEMHTYCNHKSIADPEKRDAQYWCSVAGLERIKNDPLNYVRVVLKRIPHAFFPSFYREGVSWRYKLFDRTVMSFIVIGLICASMFRNKEKFASAGLVLMGLIIYMIVIILHSEWEVRVQLAAHVLLFPVASLGWVMLLNRFNKRFQLKKRLAP